jgi:hypothetical protein
VVPGINALADEDQEQDPDRWASQSASGQEAWQLISQWVWNLRLELGHQLAPDPVRTTEFAPALPPIPAQTAPTSGSAPPQVGLRRIAGRFSGQDFALQPDGTLRCPAGQSLVAHERRREADGSLRVVYAGSIRNCRPCPLREQCLLKIAVQRVKKPPLPRSLTAVCPCLCCFLSKHYTTGCEGLIT